MNNKEAVRRYILPDAHYGHNRVCEFCDRPISFENKINNNIKTIVRPQDEIIFLGDVCFGNLDFLQHMISDLPGRKILTKGNHDKRSNTWYYKAGFDFVCDSVTIGQYVLSHMPIPINKNQINIHGHFHNCSPVKWEQYLIDQLTENHYLSALEFIDYRPILLTTAMEKKQIFKTLDLLNNS